MCLGYRRNKNSVCTAEELSSELAVGSGGRGYEERAAARGCAAAAAANSLRLPSGDGIDYFNSLASEGT